MSIRLRLTLVYTAILALLLFAISTALYFSQSRVMSRMDQNIIRSEAQRMFELPPENFHGPPGQMRDGRDRFKGVFVQQRDLKGDLLRPDPNLPEFTLPLSEQGLQAVRRGERWVETVVVDDEQFLVHSEVVSGRRGAPSIVQTAIAVTRRNEFLATLRNLLITGSVIILGVVFGISWFLAGLALRPIHKITQTAQEIGAKRDFSRRVIHPGPHDEIGELATTFNGMLNELQDAYVQVEQSLQTQQRFVADASHELRTPLTTLRGNISLLRREPPISVEDRDDVLDDMVDETERLMRLTNDLLVLARADAQRPLKHEPVAVKPLLKRIIDQVKSLAPHRALTCNSCPTATVFGDEDALKQVVLVLLDNAIKHTPDTAKIHLSCEVENGFVTINVQDTGPGIAPERLPHIFDRFYRGDEARTEGGTGLGLAIAQELAEAQNGTIAVESKVGQGSVFTLTFPKFED